MKISPMRQVSTSLLDLQRPDSSSTIFLALETHNFNQHIGTGNHEISFQYDSNRCGRSVCSDNILRDFLIGFRKPNPHITTGTDNTVN